ncbi:MAG: geranylgeranylglycerol-phosphate geranylgeranyltransferase [Crocinitomicaceae bacterium]|nr:geranylgeranylglycerol-phosphate geranylgeranyltransferase [Crocinitomicaceae bacterium]
MINFFRLIRPINLVIIALTMYSIRFFYFILSDAQALRSGEQFDFFLLVFSTVLIAAGGNIINDYFDVRTDRINRPERLIISKHIKRRWAIISHWILNAVAFSIAIYLSSRYQTFWYVFIHLVTINTLWFYSMYFKRKPFIGNLMIAVLTALVPILCGIHFYFQIGIENIESLILTPRSDLQETIVFWKSFLLRDWRFIYFLAFFAFTLNLSREIIKDIEDVEGDKQIYAKTLPLTIGIKKSAIIAGIILAIVPVTVIALILSQTSGNYEMSMIALLPIFISCVLNLISLILLSPKNGKIRNIKAADFIIKISMLSGILMPFYWWFLM